MLGISSGSREGRFAMRGAGDSFGKYAIAIGSSEASKPVRGAERGARSGCAATFAFFAERAASFSALSCSISCAQQAKQALT